MVLMQKPSVMDAPSGGAPEKAPRWDLTGTEGCGGGIRFLWCSWMVGGTWIYIGGRPRLGGCRGAHKVRGCAPPPQARPQPLWAPQGSSELHSKSPGCLLVQEKSSRKIYSVWTPFGIPFLRNSKEKKKLALGSRLIGQSQKSYKIAY